MKSSRTTTTTDFSIHHQDDHRDADPQTTVSNIGNSSHFLPSSLNHGAAHADSISSVGNDTSVWFRHPRVLTRTASTSSHHTSASATTVPSEASSDGRNTSHTIVDPIHMSAMGRKVEDEEKGGIVSSPVVSPSSASQPPLAEFRTYPIAWVALFFLVVLRSAVSIFQNTFNPIPNVVASYLNVSLTAINWLYNIMSVVYIVVSFGTGWAFETLGVKKSIIVAGILTAAGCWIRWVAVKINPPSYAVMMIGQVIASIGSPLTLNIMTKFATVWFTENRRATAGMFVASNYGGIIAMFLMPAVATGESKIEFTLILVAVICTAALVPHLFLPAKPPTPPSLDLQSHRNEGKVSVLQSIVILFKNVHFWILCGIHGLNIGLSIAWGGLTNQAVTPYGYSDAESGNIVAVGIFAGTLGCFVAGPMLDATKRHKLFLKMMAPFMCSTYVALVFVVSRDSFAAILYVNALNQFFLAFMIPVVIELGVEATYPVPESISTSILWQAAQIIGFILVLVMDKFRNPDGDPPNNMFRALIFQAAIAGFCVVLSFIYNGPMLRTQAYEEATAAMHLKNTRSSILTSTTTEHRTMRHRYQNSSETIRVVGNPDDFGKTAA